MDESMHLWPNLFPDVAELPCEGDDYLKWFAHEKARLEEDWRRDKGKLTHENHLQPLIYKRETVIQSIQKSSGAKSQSGTGALFVADFVIGLDGLLRVGYSHTKLSEVRKTAADGTLIRKIGMPVYAAGQFEYGNGVIHRINNGSGHYLPYHQSPSLLELAFDRAGLRRLIAGGEFVSDVYREPFKRKQWK